MSVAPEPKFGFSSQYVPLSLSDYITWGGQSFLLIVMIVIFFFHIASKRKEIQRQRERYAFSLYTLKYISIFSILFGFSIFLYSISGILTIVGFVGGIEFGGIAGAISDAMDPLIFGFFNASIGSICYFFAKWRNIRALESDEET